MRKAWELANPTLGGRPTAQKHGVPSKGGSYGKKYIMSRSYIMHDIVNSIKDVAPAAYVKFSSNFPSPTANLLYGGSYWGEDKILISTRDKSSPEPVFFNLL